MTYSVLDDFLLFVIVWWWWLLLLLLNVVHDDVFLKLNKKTDIKTYNTLSATRASKSQTQSTINTRDSIKLFRDQSSWHSWKSLSICFKTHLRCEEQGLLQPTAVIFSLSVKCTFPTLGLMFNFPFWHFGATESRDQTALATTQWTVHCT